VFEWWLRDAYKSTPSDTVYSVSSKTGFCPFWYYVDVFGQKLDEDGIILNLGAVRPALWIDLNA
jgi:hypothetical protein